MPIDQPDGPPEISKDGIPTYKYTVTAKKSDLEGDAPAGHYVSASGVSDIKHHLDMRERFQRKIDNKEFNDDDEHTALKELVKEHSDRMAFLLKNKQKAKAAENIHAAQGSAAGVSKAFADIEQSKSQPKK